MIKAHGLSVLCDHAALLAGVDLDVGRGQIFGLAGLNGSGRSTLLSVLATLIKPTSGRLEIDGVDALKFPHQVRPFLGYIAESPLFVDHLTVGEYLRLIAGRRGAGAESGPPSIPGLMFEPLRGETPIRQLSRGLKQQLAWTAALMHAPRLLLLDEPLCHLDDIGVARCKAALRSIRSEGRTVVMACNRVEDLQDVCDEVAFMHRGRTHKIMKLQGPGSNPADVMQDLAVLQAAESGTDDGHAGTASGKGRP